ncbi:MAG: hypothetical protein ABSA45_08965 [Verrucomicrobiota bacterium]
MNVWLWHTEYGSRGGEISVPVDLVWRKILTAPDVSALAIYQDGCRAGFCQISTSVEQAMAALDENTVPPEGLVAQSGHQIHFNGNLSFGAITNPVRFDGRLQFSSARAWRELNLKVSTREATMEIHSVAAEQKARFKITSDGANFERVLSFADLQNPDALLRALGGGLAGELDLPVVIPSSPAAIAGPVKWEAHRVRAIIGHEPVTVYRVETRVLDHPLVLYASSLGEIVRMELPGGVTAVLDEWNKP